MFPRAPRTSTRRNLARTLLTAVAAVALMAANLTALNIATTSQAPLASAAPCPTAVQPREGSGTFTVDDSAQLQGLLETPALWDDTIILTNDIDMGGCEWTSTIGTDDDPFEGSFDGAGFLISGLTINMPDDRKVGLFGDLYGEVRNIRFSGQVNGDERVGGLVGFSSDGEVHNSHFIGDVSGSREVGGLVGFADPVTVTASSASGTVSAIAGQYVGGLVGYVDEYSEIDQSYSTVVVTATTNESNVKFVGGLVGFTEDASLTNSWASGDVTVMVNAMVPEDDDDELELSVEHVGGLVGRSISGSSITGSRASGNVTVTVTVTVPADAEGDLDVEVIRVGGLAGSADSSPIAGSWASGDVSITTNSPDYVFARATGGLVGEHRLETIENSYATGDVTGDEQVGGLVGFGDLNPTIKIQRSFAEGEVVGQDYVGGFIGQLSDGVIENSYATGSVMGLRDTDDSNFTGVGGFIGRFDAGRSSSIKNSYALGNVALNSPGSKVWVGSFAGYSTDPIEASFSAGTVNGSPATDDSFVGDADDTPTIGPVTLNQMQDITTFTTFPADWPIKIGWTEWVDESSVTWGVCSPANEAVNSGAPFLNWQYTANPCSSPGPGPEPTPVFPPSAPLNVSGAAGDASAVITWTAPESPGSFAITNYEAVVFPGGQICLVSAPTQTCTITGLTNGRTYTATVRALNGAGWGPYSAASNEFTPSGSPTPVATITITGSRTDVRGRPGVTVTGTTTGLTGATVQARVRLAGETSYSNGATRVVNPQGTFTWQRRTPRAVYVYFRDVANPSVRSERVVLPPR